MKRQEIRTERQQNKFAGHRKILSKRTFTIVNITTT